MEVVFVNTAMPMSPFTLSRATLGGSETAVMMAAQEMSKLGHMVSIFTPLPPEGRADAIQSGFTDDSGVRWLRHDSYPDFIGNTEVDLLIVCRDPMAIATTNCAKKRVLWMHDIATHRGMQKAFDQMNWCFDEVWCVSEWHRQQVNEVTGYPLKNIVALRNGIVPIELLTEPFREEKVLCYAARPERGLENLIKEGGVMEHLPDYKLRLSFYNNTHESMMPLYSWCDHRISQMANVETPDELPQNEMRQRLASVSAYVYPTQFEETSCILARECIEQRTPFLTTKEGALPETLGDSGVFFEDWVEGEIPEKGSPEWCKLFADFIRFSFEDEEGKKKVNDSLKAMEKRDDLYWDGVAKMMEENAAPVGTTVFSRAWSLVLDGDIVPAYEFLKKDASCEYSKTLLDQIEMYYPFILPEADSRHMTLSDYYNDVFYSFKHDELAINEYGLAGCRNSPRYSMIFDALSSLEDGSVVIEYGAGEGHVIVNAARDFPKIQFIAFDQVQTNVDSHKEYGELDNLVSYQANTPEQAKEVLQSLTPTFPAVDAAICVEVLEHCPDPFSVIDGVESMVKPGGKVIITTPYGPWEPLTFFFKPEEFHLRNHIWHFTKSFIRDVFRGKEDMQLAAIACGRADWCDSAIGNYFYSYTANHVPVNRVDPYEKALREGSRQTVGAAVIAYNNEDSILKMLNSVRHQVQVIQIALGPCTDDTRGIIESFQRKNPHLFVHIIEVPKIEAPKEYGGTADKGFGFDDARNISAEGLPDTVDWILWIDTDEYLSGNLARYTRNNCLDGYLIPQHHFTVEPRGGATQIDRPARLFRARVGYRAMGHIHEHFEVPDGGPGHCFMLPDVDIGHTGYVNENRRRDRFARNFPFLVWDHHENPDRRLHPFLWFRDIVHRMRYAMMEGNQEAAMALAREGERYYEDHYEEMSNYGAGLSVGLDYLTEVRSVLGKGTKIELHFRLDDREASIAGSFLDIDEVYAILGQVLESEVKTRNSRYY